MRWKPNVKEKDVKRRKSKRRWRKSSCASKKKRGKSTYV